MSNHEEGTAHLAFTINRQGRVTSTHIVGSSGSLALDAETLECVHRVSIPPPPAGAQISLVVSLRYNIPRY
jgi:periplasmic protein TonB